MLVDDFVSEYWPREETLEQIWTWVLGRSRGHLQISGPPGCGKSWLTRGLAIGAQERGALPLYLERSPEENLASLVWRLVDATEFMVEIDGESLRMAVSQKLYEADPAQALLALMGWLTQELEGSFLILLDGFDSPELLQEFPSWRDFPEAVYLISCGRTTTSGETLVLQPQEEGHLTDLRGYLEKKLPVEHHSQIEQVLALSSGNWRQAYDYCICLKLGLASLPPSQELFERLLDAYARKIGGELFRTIHLEVLLLLAVAQVPASLDLLKAWGVPAGPLGFALFELRELLVTDGEGSQYDALFTGEHYSLRSPDLRHYLLENSAWLDRVSDCHRRAVSRALEQPSQRFLQEMPQDVDYYSRAFAQHHLRASGRSGDLQRLISDPSTAEQSWTLGRLAREQGYEEIGLQLFLVAGQLLEARSGETARATRLRQAELCADCCQALTNQGRYSDAAHYGERALEVLRPLVSQEGPEAVLGLLSHCLLSLADPYLYMGYVNRAYPLYSEAYERSHQEMGAEQAKAIHALRGLARASRAMAKTEDAVRQGLQALELARKLTRDEGEEWAQYLFELLMEQSETLRGFRETLPQPPGPLESMGLRWESLRLLREAEELYQRFHWPGDQELVFLYLEQSMALFDLEKWAEAEERLREAIEVLNDLPAGDSHPADLASLEFLRSHALALMNRIGEASGSLANLLTPELMAEMDLSEQALVLFFRAKILSHQGLLGQAEEALEESIEAYGEAIEQGAEDLILEQLSACIYRARVCARRGRLPQAQSLAQQCFEHLLELESEDGSTALEVADVSELESWIHQALGQYSQGLEASQRAAEALEQIRGQESEADVETERSLNLVTQALNWAGLKNFPEALRLAEMAVEMERRRAQEGYQQAHMWSAVHCLSLAKLFRQAGQPQSALDAARQAHHDLTALPANQQQHLGLHLAAVQMEIAVAQIQLECWSEVREPLKQACSLYENEMWQNKEYLIATLWECQRIWLDFCWRSSNGNWQDRSAWNQVFEVWQRCQTQIQEEEENFFLYESQSRFEEWLLSLPASIQQEWNERAPAGLRFQ